MPEVRVLLGPNHDLVKGKILFNKLDQIVEKYEKLSDVLSSNTDFKSKEYSQIVKEHRLLEKTVNLYQQFKEIDKQVKETKEL
ncbi:MAG TPA: hypothetical protein ENI73_04305, partial [Spirochaetes bacterium]|nr:hypothetical protein [Spirochaetota bacterium]